MNFLKKLDQKFRNYLESQIEKQDKIAADLKEEEELDNRKEEIGQIKNLGLFFMDKRKEYKEKNRDLYNMDVLDFYYMLGCASQGRKEEVESFLEDWKADESLNKIAVEVEPRILNMTKISKKIEDTPIGEDMRGNESIEEYESRKLKKSKSFMKDFNYFKNLDLNEFILDRT